MSAKANDRLKWVFDRTVAFAGTLAVSPVFLAIFLALKISEPSQPAFFRQLRIGQHARPFYILKFRIMKTGITGSHITVAGDPRITKIGKFLRRFRLDELPQLINVLKSDMSFVGPRPDVPGYADCLEGDDRIILCLKPGITGPATLKYRNEEEILARQEDPVLYNDTVIWRDKVKINLEYAAKHSFWGDLKLILQTLHILKAPNC